MIPLFKVFMPEDISIGIQDVINSGQLTYGAHTKRFEEKLVEFVCNPNILTVSGNSVYFALKLIDVDYRDEVIVSPMSCLATTQPIAYAGAKTVWADVDPLTGSLNPDDVKRKITSKTKAIIHYHWSGYPGYIDEINAIAKERGIMVIEDASESFGAEYKGNKLGNTDTDIVCYAFTPVRLPNAIDGGGLAIKDRSLFEKALLMRDYGINRAKFRDNLGEISVDCDISIPGNGWTMNNVSGYIGACQMDYIGSLYSKQRENAKKWTTYFASNNDVIHLKSVDTNPSYWSYTILSNNREDLLVEFRKNGYYASKMHLRNDLYSVFTKPKGGLKGVDEFSRKQLNIPCGWWLNSSDIVYGKQN